MKTAFSGGVVIFISALLPITATATHLRAVEIQVRQTQCPGTTVEIIVTAYVSLSGVLFGDGTLYFGDGTSVQVPEIESQIIDAESQVGRAQYRVTHSYANNGLYKISYSETNRNAGILNFTGSVNTPFFAETSILLEPGVCNSSAVLPVPPIDRGCTGVAFYHNPGAFDTDGDSLSYTLVPPKQSATADVSDYVLPDNQRFYASAGITYDQGNENKNGRPSFRVDPVTGTVTWDAPGSPGEYAFAVKITEWKYKDATRTWYQAGYVLRDMQVIVEECSNNKPVMQVPLEVCVIAGNTLDILLPASDPDRHDVVIEVFSEVFGGDKQITTNPPLGARQSTTPPEAATFRITWTTKCEDVRPQPYRIVLKISDRPLSGPRLVNFYTLDITVIAPAPEFEQVTINPVTKTVTLEWEDYLCNNVSAFQIWRRTSEYRYDQPECETGLPAFLRYQLMAEVSGTTVSYVDSDLSVGSLYCYRIVPLIGDKKLPGRISADTCFIPKPAEAPVIVNVSIESTDKTSGQVLVRWTEPFDIDRNQYPAPYLYKVWRKNESDPQSVFSAATSGLISDTVFTDAGLNTRENIYRYKIELYVPALTSAPVDTSSEASSVFASTQGIVDGITVKWAANTPWSNYSQRDPYHLIYRSTSMSGPFELIDSVDVTLADFQYTDRGAYQNRGLSGLPYYYKIRTRGSYGNPSIADPLQNLSQITPGQLLDTIPPCAASVSIRPINCSDFACDGSDYSTTLEWVSDCDDEALTYEVFVLDDDAGVYQLLATVDEQTFVHGNISSLDKCYRVISVDNAGNRSDSSEVVCNVNCLNFKLPNVITPGVKDDRNDYLTTYPADENERENCARSVQTVELTIFSRWGDKVFTNTITGDSHIFWDGRNMSGREVASGVYFYQATVVFNTRDVTQQNQEMKGWVQVIR